MSESDWQVSFAKTVGVYLAGDGLPSQGVTGRRTDPMSGASYFVVLNAFWEPLEFVLPGAPFGALWLPVLDTAREQDPFMEQAAENAPVAAGAGLPIGGRALFVLKRVDSPADTDWDTIRVREPM